MTLVETAAPVQPAIIPTKPHVPALDGIRGTAILLVLFHHLSGELGNTTFGRIAARIGTPGWVGVDLFFVLSGYLITGILLRSFGDAHYFRNFYMRRTLRIFPLYFGTILVALVIVGASMAPLAPWLLTYTSNLKLLLGHDWVLKTDSLNFNHFWSLAVEEHFYLVWPAVIWFTQGRWMLAITAAAVVFAAAHKLVLWRMGLAGVGSYTWTLCRFDSLLIGGCAQVLSRAGRWQVPTIVNVGMGLVIFGIFCFNGLKDGSILVQLIACPMAALLFASLIIKSRDGVYREMFSSPVLRWFGTYSYGIYVFHLLFEPMVTATFGFGIGSAGILGAGSIVLAVASYHLWESPFLRLKSKFD